MFGFYLFPRHPSSSFVADVHLHAGWMAADWLDGIGRKGTYSVSQPGDCPACRSIENMCLQVDRAFVLKNSPTKRDLWLICRSSAAPRIYLSSVVVVPVFCDSSDAVDVVGQLHSLAISFGCLVALLGPGDPRVWPFLCYDRRHIINQFSDEDDDDEDHTGGILLCAVLLYYSWWAPSSPLPCYANMQPTEEQDVRNGEDQIVCEEGICWYLPLANTDECEHWVEWFKGRM